jgi:hypothetical protein
VRTSMATKAAAAMKPAFRTGQTLPIMAIYPYIRQIFPLILLARAPMRKNSQALPHG